MLTNEVEEIVTVQDQNERFCFVSQRPVLADSRIPELLLLATGDSYDMVVDNKTKKTTSSSEKIKWLC